MGYSISVQFASYEEKEEMKNFLNENKSLIQEMKNENGNPIMIEEGDVLSYAPQEEKETLLGVHGSITSPSMWRICSWMAEKSSIRNSDGKAYIYYDDEIMLLSNDPQSQDILVDKKGIFVKRKMSFEAPFVDKVFNFIKNKLDKKEDELHHKILTQLEEKWQEYKNSFQTNHQPFKRKI